MASSTSPGDSASPLSSSVTTFVPHRPDGVRRQNTRPTPTPELRYTSGRGKVEQDLEVALRSLPVRGWMRAMGAVVATAEGRDAVLYEIQSLLLLMHSSLSSPRHKLSPISPLVLFLLFQPPTRRLALRRIHLASEVISTSRRMILLARLCIGATKGAVAVEQKVEEVVTDSPDEKQNEKSQNDVDVEEDSDDEDVSVLDANYDEDEETSGEAAHDQRSALKSLDFWRSSFARRLGEAAGWLGTVGDCCDMAAFLGGSSIVWRVAGLKSGVGARQRRGLERVALYFGLASLLVTLVQLHTRYARARVHLRASNVSLLALTDRLADVTPGASARLLHGRQISFTQATSGRGSTELELELEAESSAEKQEKVEEASQPAPPPDFDGCGPPGRQWGVSKHSFDRSPSPTAYTESLLRKEEARLARLRRRARSIRLERWAARAETLFSLLEVFLPHRDNQRAEAVCGVVAATSGLINCGSRARWGEE